jgi:hypothetical protein
MGMFLARAMAGGDSEVPALGAVAGRDGYACEVGGVSLFADVAPTDQYCRHVHFVAGRGTTLGCGDGSTYCPTAQVNRGQMAMFVARAVAGSDAAVPVTYADSGTGRQYSCGIASPVLHFSDVTATAAFCRHAHYLWARGFVDGCTSTAFCPANLVTRGQMAKFLVNGFALQLGAP